MIVKIILTAFLLFLLTYYLLPDNYETLKDILLNLSAEMFGIWITLIVINLLFDSFQQERWKNFDARITESIKNFIANIHFLIIHELDELKAGDNDKNYRNKISLSEVSKHMEQMVQNFPQRIEQEIPHFTKNKISSFIRKFEQILNNIDNIINRLEKRGFIEEIDKLEEIKRIGDIINLNLNSALVAFMSTDNQKTIAEIFGNNGFISEPLKNLIDKISKLSKHLETRFGVKPWYNNEHLQ